MSVFSVRKLLNKSLSTSKQHSQFPAKPSSITSKSQTFFDENSPPIDPNIQPNQFRQSPSIMPKKSSFKSEISLNTLDFKGHNPSVKVMVRIRPKTVDEKLGDPSIKRVNDVSLNVGDRRFDFDSVFDSNSKQEDVFKLVGVPLVKDALDGYNASVLSYGQTGTGKTYTMWGPSSALVEGQSLGTQRGLVPQIFQMLFSEIERKKSTSGDQQMNYQCRCSFLEIHEGHIGDLLDPTRRNIQIKDDAKVGFHIENLTEEYVTCYDDVTQLLMKGLLSRKFGATSINSESFRSHIVFTCVIESWCKGTSSNNFSSSKTSRISFIDLGGLVRDKQIDAGGEFEAERKDLDNSLSLLGHLVNMLAAGTQPTEVMYKDSSLTHLLQQSLGGNAKLAVVCTISADIKNYVETLSTLRFGQRMRSIQNKPVINEMTEENMNDLTDQIRHLKEELIRTKLNDNSVEAGNGKFAGRSIRESVNQLRINLNRSLILPSIGNDTEDDINTDENEVAELCKQLDILHTSFDENSRDHSCDSDSMIFSSVRGSCDISELESNSLQESVEVNSVDAPDSSSRNSIAVTSSHHSEAFEEPAFSESPRIRNLERNGMVKSPSLLAKQDTVSESITPITNVSRSVRQSEQKRSSLRSSRLFSGTPENLAASLKKGLDAIDFHQQNVPSNRDSIAFSFEHFMLKPSPASDKISASVQTLSPSSFICISCRQKGEDVPNEVEDSLKTWLSNAKKEGELDAAEGKLRTDKENELQKVCDEQAAKIEELNHLVEQLKNVKKEDFETQTCQGFDDKTVCEDSESMETEIVKQTYDLVVNHSSEKETFNMREKEELLMEIQSLKSKLQAYTDSAPRKSIDMLRSSLLSRSMQIRKSMSSQFNNPEELEKERERWTEMESEWINLTDELRIDIESHRQYAEKVEMELQQEKKHTEELDDALQRAVLGHAQFVEHFVDLQEKYNHLSESHKRVMETITDVKRAAAKAGSKGSGARYAKAFAAELTTMRAEERRERERLRKENKSLRIQLRETAEAVQTAGELLVRLREAEETASFAESNMTDLQQENEKLKKEIENLKNKHKVEIGSMKQYMAESKLPEAALRPVQYDDEPLPASTFNTSQDDGDWRAAFGDIYQHHHY
ncbi:hypothetical protein vseg_005396 [Gypsophila vaccaria]